VRRIAILEGLLRGHGNAMDYWVFSTLLPKMEKKADLTFSSPALLDTFAYEIEAFEIQPHNTMTTLRSSHTAKRASGEKDSRKIWDRLSLDPTVLQNRTDEIERLGSFNEINSGQNSKINSESLLKTIQKAGLLHSEISDVRMTISSEHSLSRHNSRPLEDAKSFADMAAKTVLDSKKSESAVSLASSAKNSRINMDSKTSESAISLASSTGSHKECRSRSRSNPGEVWAAIRLSQLIDRNVSPEIENSNIGKTIDGEESVN
jgi:hypothetical protein